MLEIEIKKRLIDHLLSRMDLEMDLLISEFPYMDHGRRADLVLFDRNGLHAFEIKGEKDSIKRVFSQIEDYSKCFDTLTLVLTQKHLNVLKDLVSKKIGTATIDERGIIWLSLPQRRVRLQKEALLNILTIAQLKQHFELSNKIGAKDDIVKSISKSYNVESIRAKVHAAVELKYKGIFRLFLKERGEVTIEEDVKTLSANKELRLGV